MFDDFNSMNLGFEGQQMFDQLSDSEKELFVKAYHLGYQKVRNEAVRMAIEKVMMKDTKKVTMMAMTKGGYDQSNDMGPYPSDF